MKLTPTQARDLETCGLKFKLAHLDRVPQTASSTSKAALGYGTAMHAALEEIHCKLQQQGSSPPDLLLGRHWDSSYFNQDEEDYFHMGCQALAQYLATNAVNPPDVLATERFAARAVRTPSGEVVLSAKIDRIDRIDQTTIEVLDYKTSRSGAVPTEDALAQDIGTFIYYLLGRLLYPGCAVRVAQLNVQSMMKTTCGYTPESVAANKLRLDKLVRKMNTGGFAPEESSACAWCPYHERCPLYAKATDLATI